MRRGRATLPHPQPRSDDTGRHLVTPHVAAFLTHRHVEYVRRLVPPVACDVLTRVALIDLDAAERTLNDRPRRLSRRVS